MISGGDIIAISPAKRISIPKAVHCPEKYPATPTIQKDQTFSVRQIIMPEPLKDERIMVLK